MAISAERVSRRGRNHAGPSAMAKRVKALAPVALLIMLTGCEPVKSVQPFFLPADVQFDPALVGDWRGVKTAEDDTGLLLHFEKATEDSYTVRLTAENAEKPKEGAFQKATWTFEGHLFRCAGSLFLDLKLEDEQLKIRGEEFSIKKNDMGFLLVETHTVYRVKREGDALKLAPLDDDKVDKFLGEKKHGIAAGDGSQLLLIADTPDLQKRILAQAETGHLLSDDLVFARVK